MKINKILATYAVINLALLTSKVFASGVGNGGDPLMILFDQGRQDAVDRVEKLLSCSFRADVDPEARDFILNNQAALIADLRNSKQVWITDPQATCAFTSPSSNSDIFLSFESCRPGIQTKENAGRLLIHETVHHFGEINETVADSVAMAVYSASPVRVCPNLPTENDSCRGPLLTTADVIGTMNPGANSTPFFGGYRVFQTSRTCNSLTGCAPWSPEAIVKEGAYSASIDDSTGNVYLNLGLDVPTCSQLSPDSVVECRFDKSVDPVGNYSFSPSHFRENCLNLQASKIESSQGFGNTKETKLAFQGVHSINRNEISPLLKNHSTLVPMRCKYTGGNNAGYSDQFAIKISESGEVSVHSQHGNALLVSGLQMQNGGSYYDYLINQGSDGITRTTVSVEAAGSALSVDYYTSSDYTRISNHCQGLYFAQ
jgi:hypothetical protein